MGKQFGNLAKITGVTYFRLSPYEQNPFAGSIDGAGRVVKMLSSRFIRIAPIFMGTYLLMLWAEEENYKINRKNPKDFENDT